MLAAPLPSSPAYPLPDYVEAPQTPEALRSDEYLQLLRRDPRRYADLIRAISAFGVCFIDLDGRVASWNRGARRLSGWRDNEILGRPYARLFAGDVAAELPRQTLDLARLHGHCRSEQRRRRPDGSQFVADCAIDVVRSESGEMIGFVEVFQDVTEQKAQQTELYERATRDALTRVCNRSHFLEIGAQELERARRFAEPLSVAVFDVDQFRRFNENWTTANGDRVLLAVAQALSQQLRRIDTVGRLGGDEFAVVLPRCDKDFALEVAQRLRLGVATRKVATDTQRNVAVTVSGGVAALRALTRDFGELLRQADAALFKAKRERGNTVRAWFE